MGDKWGRPKRQALHIPYYYHLSHDRFDSINYGLETRTITAYPTQVQ